jgi:hypothetical protein
MPNPSLYRPAKALSAAAKHVLILRIETTTYDPSWFSHYRTVVHRNGTSSHELTPLKKSIYSLFDFGQLAVAANRRYLAFISALDDPTVSVDRGRTLTTMGLKLKNLVLIPELAREMAV